MISWRTHCPTWPPALWQARLAATSLFRQPSRYRAAPQPGGGSCSGRWPSRGNAIGHAPKLNSQRSPALAIHLLYFASSLHGNVIIPLAAAVCEQRGRPISACMLETGLQM